MNTIKDRLQSFVENALFLVSLLLVFGFGAFMRPYMESPYNGLYEVGGIVLVLTVFCFGAGCRVGHAHGTRSALVAQKQASAKTVYVAPRPAVPSMELPENYQTTRPHIQAAHVARPGMGNTQQPNHRPGPAKRPPLTGANYYGQNQEGL